jgi:hypothetical protein
MCLIITGTSKNIRSTLLETAGLIEDIYSSNSDGVGFMYATKKGLKVIKRMPRSAAEVATMVRSMPTDDRNLAIHFRYTTHGDTNLDNCHPYDVVPGFIAMMHNGILHTGNAADKARSDTYHFIKDFLAEPMHGAPDLAFSDSFLKLVGSFIRDNRFVFMDGEGRISHVNKATGIEHGDLWFSNTYAWSPELLIPTYRSKYAGYGKGYAHGSRSYGAYGDYEQEDALDHTWQTHWSNPKRTDRNAPSTVADALAADSFDDADNHDTMYPRAKDTLPTKEEIIELLVDGDVDGLEDRLSTFPFTTLDLLLLEFDASPTPSLSGFAADALSKREYAVFRAIIERKEDELQRFIRADEEGASTVAEVACYYTEWTERDTRFHRPQPTVNLTPAK